MEVKQLLWNLQNADNELKEILTTLEEIPKKINFVRKSIQAKEEEAQEIKERIKNLTKERNFAELDLKEIESKIEKYSAQLYQAKTNEEYKALLNEIDAAKKKKIEIENKIIELMETIEIELERDKKMDRDLEEYKKEKEKKIEEKQRKDKELREELKIVQETIERLRKEVPNDYLQIYDRIKKNKGNIAVSKLTEDNRCSVCFNIIPLQKVIEIQHKKDNLFFCEYCGRLLID